MQASCSVALSCNFTLSTIDKICYAAACIRLSMLHARCILGHESKAGRTSICGLVRRHYTCKQLETSFCYCKVADKFQAANRTEMQTSHAQPSWAVLYSSGTVSTS